DTLLTSPKFKAVIFQRRLMRGRNAFGVALLLVLVAAALGIGRFSAALLDFDAGAYSGRLVSIEPVSEIGDMCLWEPVSARQITSLEPSILFAASKDKHVLAASQDSGATADIARPPVRNILDTDPIYSAVTVDTRLNEVYLQDPNTWSIRVFDRTEN